MKRHILRFTQITFFLFFIFGYTGCLWTENPPGYLNNNIAIYKFKDATYCNYVWADTAKFSETNELPAFVENTYIVRSEASRKVSVCELATHNKYIFLHQNYVLCYPYKLDYGTEYMNRQIMLWDILWTDICDSAKLSTAMIKDSFPIMEAWRLRDPSRELKGFPDNIGEKQIEDYVNDIIDKGELEKYGAQFMHF